MEKVIWSELLDSLTSVAAMQHVMFRTSPAVKRMPREGEPVLKKKQLAVIIRVSALNNCLVHFTMMNVPVSDRQLVVSGNSENPDQEEIRTKRKHPDH